MPPLSYSYVANGALKDKKRKPTDNQVDADIQIKAKPLNEEVVFQIEDEKKSNNNQQIKHVEELNRGIQLEHILCGECLMKADEIKMCIKHVKNPAFENSATKQTTSF